MAHTAARAATLDSRLRGNDGVAGISSQTLRSIAPAEAPGWIEKKEPVDKKEE